jgi:hypothetical protein
MYHIHVYRYFSISADNGSLEMVVLFEFALFGIIIICDIW